MIPKLKNFPRCKVPSLLHVFVRKCLHASIFDCSLFRSATNSNEIRASNRVAKSCQDAARWNDAVFRPMERVTSVHNAIVKHEIRQPKLSKCTVFVNRDSSDLDY